MDINISPATLLSDVAENKGHSPSEVNNTQFLEITVGDWDKNEPIEMREIG